MSTPTTIDEFICFALYKASHATSQAYREVLAPWNITYTQYLALVVLGAGERTVSELGAELGLDSGTLSPLLRRLESRELVVRERATHDERVVLVSLTDHGRATRAELISAVACLVPALTSPGDLPSFMSGLREITAGMRELTTARRAR